MIRALVISNLLLLLLVSQQQVDAWWFLANPAGQQQVAPATTSTLKAVAEFNLDGVQGRFTFNQKSPSEPTHCEYDLRGLKGNNKFYHVHVRPVPPFDASKVKNNASAIAELCSDPTTGGHLNPHHITAKLPPKSAPLDQYETGDLSGKHGPLNKQTGYDDDHYVGSFSDDKLPMFGPNSIIGRSIVIHKNDGKRWVCASIVELSN